MPQGKVEKHFIVTVRKFHNEEHRIFYRVLPRIFGTEPYETLISKHSDLLDEGADELIDLICGLGTPTKWDNANAYCGVGDSSAVFDATHTDLQGANKTYKAMDATYPQRIAGQKGRWRSTYASAEGNHSWQEFTVSNTSSGTGKNLMRILADKGTKSAGETWELTIDEEFS